MEIKREVIARIDLLNKKGKDIGLKYPISASDIPNLVISRLTGEIVPLDKVKKENDFEKNYFHSKMLCNALENYFNGKEAEELTSCISFDSLNDPVVLVPKKPLELKGNEIVPTAGTIVNAGEEKMLKMKTDPIGADPLSDPPTLPLPIIKFLLGQEGLEQAPIKAIGKEQLIKPTSKSIIWGKMSAAQGEKVLLDAIHWMEQYSYHTGIDLKEIQKDRSRPHILRESSVANNLTITHLIALPGKEVNHRRLVLTDNGWGFPEETTEDKIVALTPENLTRALPKLFEFLKNYGYSANCRILPEYDKKQKVFSWLTNNAAAYVANLGGLECIIAKNEHLKALPENLLKPLICPLDTGPAKLMRTPYIYIGKPHPNFGTGISYEYENIKKYCEEYFEEDEALFSYFCPNEDLKKLICRSDHWNVYVEAIMGLWGINDGKTKVDDLVILPNNTSKRSSENARQVHGLFANQDNLSAPVPNLNLQQFFVAWREYKQSLQSGFSMKDF